MVDDPTTPTGPEAPAPYDLIRLVPGNPLGVDPGTLLIIADTVDNAPGVYEVHHQDTHPGYMDWAGAVTVEDIATVLRITDTTAYSWSPRP